MTRPLVLGCLLAAGLPATAQPPAPARPVAAPAQVIVRPAIQPRQVWPDQQFENWVFGDARTTDGAKRRLDTLTTLQLEEIDRVCRLDPEQKRKLRLLGWGDAKRVLDAYEAARLRFAELGNDVNRLQEVMPQVQPVQAALRGGPFAPGSLLAKGLRHTLSDDQLARYEAVVRERQAARHQAQVELALLTFEEGVPLTAAQRGALLAVLKAETRPVGDSQYAQYVLMHQLSRLPEDKVKPILSDSQWRAWTGMVNQYQGVIQNLLRQGLIPDDEPPPAGKD